MHKNNIIPKGERNLHIRSTECKCNPNRVIINNKKFLFHHSFDSREIWLGIESMLGITCYEHHDYVDKNYKRGEPHYHIPPPKPDYEYDHTKIDPR